MSDTSLDVSMVLQIVKGGGLQGFAKVVCIHTPESKFGTYVIGKMGGWRDDWPKTLAHTLQFQKEFSITVVTKACP